MIEDFFRKVLLVVNNSQLITSVPVGGGCINHAAKLTTGIGSYFIKWNSLEEADLFKKEAKDLSLLREKAEVKIPEVLSHGQEGDKAYLLLEWIDTGYTSNDFWEIFGQKLARMHKCHSADFGLNYNNHIGKLKQSNKQHKSWSDFFISERLEPQLKLASNNRLIDSETLSSFNLLFKELENLIPQEQPSLIHGDLWSGNFLVDQANEPVLIDPAVHFGHRETELSFTHLFGGFDSKFYQAYDEEFPLEPGFEDRIDIHNLYPLLVHVNLFGSSYLSGIKQTLKRFA